MCLIPRGGQHGVEARGNARAIRRTNGRISVPQGQKTERVVVRVKRGLELRASETSGREKGCNCCDYTEQT